MAPTKQISTSQGFQDSQGNKVNGGLLMLTLSQTATVTATGGQVTTEPMYFPLDINGKITAKAIWFNDELSPSGTIYYGKVFASNKTRVIPGLDNLQYSITGGSFDLSTAVQSGAASPSYSGAVLLTPTGNQVITTGSLTLTTGSFVETANAVTGTGGLVRATSPTLTTPNIGTATATSVNKVTITAPATAATLTLANNSTLTGQATGTIVNKDSTDALTNKTVTGTGSGNSITLLNSQDTLGNVTGNGADQTLYTYTIPANTVQAGKGIRLTSFIGINNTVSITWKVTLGTTSVTVVDAGATSGGTAMFKVEIFNNAGVQNAQVWTINIIDAATVLSTTTITSAENLANALALKVTANEANPNTVTPKKWIVELIQ